MRSFALALATLVIATTSTGLSEEREALPAARLRDAIATLAAEARRSVDDNRVTGLAVAVVQGEQVLFAKGYGVRDTGTGEPINTDTVFQLASMSKPIGSTVISGLVGDGKLTWDTRLADLMPEFTMFQPWVTSEITIRDLYSHRSGLPDHAGDLLEDYGYDREEILHRLRFQPPAARHSR